MDRVRSGILKIEAASLRLMKWVLFALSGAMTATVLLGVCFRYVLKAPLPWGEELGRYLMIWGASLGASVAFREGSHVGVTMIMDRFHGKTGITLTKLAQFIVILFMAIVMIEGFVLVLKLKGQTSTAMEIPMAWAYLAIPVGCLLILLEALIMIFFKGHQSLEKSGEQL
jgi:TRAP-type C4-dicarboxylate transport system permease small subunit